MSVSCPGIKEWLKSIGYDNEIPESLNKICNPSTAFIWEQIVSNVKPKQEVANARKNIIINRLKQKSLEEQDQFNYPVKELKIFLEKRDLEKRVNILENIIEEKEAKVDELLNKNKTTYVAIDMVKSKIREHIEKKYLLERKYKMIEENIDNAQEMLTLARNLTPVEMDENTNGNDITETLQKCAEKLCKLVQDMPFPNNMSHTNRSLSLLTRTKTPVKSPKNSVFSKFLNRSDLNDVKPAIRRGDDKENIDKRKSEKKKQSKRESLGLIPNSYLDYCDEFDDVFLLNPNKSEVSFVKTSFSNSSQNSSTLLLETLTRKDSEEIIKKLCDDQQVKEILQNVLYKNNRQLIIKSCRSVFEYLFGEIRNSTLECNKMDKASRCLDQEDLIRLYFFHVKKELEKDKYRTVLKKSQQNMRKRKEEIYSLLNINSKNELKDKFELQVEEAMLVACNNFLRQKINSIKKIEVNDELQVISVKIRKTKEDIFLVVNHIRSLIEIIFKLLELIKNNREKTLACVRSINPYIFNLPMAIRLKEELNSKEVEVFHNFPLEYNRRFRNNGFRYFYRDLSTTIIPPYLDISLDDIEMVTFLMDIPFSTVESAIINILRLKVKLNLLRSLQAPLKCQNIDHTYSLEELHRREEYIEPVMNKLQSIIHSTSVKQVISAPDIIRKVVDLWMQMPLRNFVSEKRLVNGQNYTFYEKTFNNLYNNM